MLVIISESRFIPIDEIDGNIDFSNKRVISLTEALGGLRPIR